MTVVCITGMHRSGTSLLARLVNLMGVSLGPRDALMEAKPDNPKGFWEAVPLVQMSDRVLGRMGGSWKRPPPLPPGWEHDPRLDDVRRDAQQAFTALFAGQDENSLYGWKDPRAGILLPFWRTVVDIDLVIAAIRHPVEVAVSLRAREPIEDGDAAALWLRYTCGAVTHDLPLFIADHRDPFQRLDGLVDDLAAFLGVEVGTEQRERIRGFIDPELWRATTDDTTVVDGRLRAAREFFRRHPTSDGDWRELARELHWADLGRRSGDELDAMSVRLRATEDELGEARSRLARARAARDHLNQVTQDQQRRLETVTKAAAAARRQQTRQLERLARAEQYIDQLERDRNSLEGA